MCVVWLKNEKLRLTFTALVAVKRKHPTPEQVMELFIVRVKHNWKWIGAYLSNEVACLLIAVQMQNTIQLRYELSIYHRYWS